MADILLEISRDYGISFDELNERYGVRMDNADEHRCSAINKNGKRCVKMRKDGADVCAIHYNSMRRVQEAENQDTKTDPSDNTDGSAEKNTESKTVRVKRTGKEKMIDTATMIRKQEEILATRSASSSSGIMIVESEKKRGIYPEKIKRITYAGRQYYINKTGWVYEMNQEDEMILSDIPIGKMMNDRIVRLNYM